MAAASAAASAIALLGSQSKGLTVKSLQSFHGTVGSRTGTKLERTDLVELQA